MARGGLAHLKLVHFTPGNAARTCAVVDPGCSVPAQPDHASGSGGRTHVKAPCGLLRCNQSTTAGAAHTCHMKFQEGYAQSRTLAVAAHGKQGRIPYSNSAPWQMHGHRNAATEGALVCRQRRIGLVTATLTPLRHCAARTEASSLACQSAITVVGASAHSVTGRFSSLRSRRVPSSVILCIAS